MTHAWRWAFVFCVGIGTLPGIAFAHEPPDGRTWTVRLPDPPDGDAGWLGVQIGPVPRSLAAHLDLDGPAMMVQNVAQDSPADRAGIDQYDVVLKLDGERVPAECPRFSEILRGKRPGTEVRLDLIHKGRPRDVRVILDRMPPPDRIRYKHPRHPEEMIRDSFSIRGKILRPNPHGPGYILEDLGERPDLEPHMFFFNEPPPGAGQPPNPDRLREWGEALRKYREQIDKYRDLYRYVDPDKLRKKLDEWVGKREDPGSSAERERPGDTDRRFTSFAVDASGRITVTIRRANSEIRMEFENAEQFRQKSPDLFREFEDIQKRTK